MSDTGYVFNPNNWKQDNLSGLADNTIDQLDERYVNVGESVFNETIDNLNATNLNISTTGKIFFIGNNTEQTTAYDPNAVSAMINDFTTSDNLFTGENKFRNLNIVDVIGNESKIYQDGVNTYIENTLLSGGINFKTTNTIGTTTTSIDQYGNFIVPNDITSTTVKAVSLLINNVFSLGIDGNGSTVFQNLGAGKGMLWRTKQLNGSDGWQLVYENNGQLYGMSNIITHSSESKSYKFRDPTTFSLTNSQIYLSSGKELIIENQLTSSSIKLRTSDNSGNVRTLTFDQFMNMSGVSSITMTGLLRINNIVHSRTNSTYTISNTTSGANFSLQHTDQNGIMRQLQIDQFINMSGVNELRCSSLFVNNIQFNPSDFNNLNTQCQQISYYHDPAQTRITRPSTGKGIYFCPDTTTVVYNPIAQAKDSVVVFANALPDSEGALTLTNWSQTNKSGLRIKSNETEAYNLKVLDGGLKFSDNTVQTTAMTNSYLTSYIQTVVNQMNIAPSVPVGTILAYPGEINSGVPDGYFWCIGGLTTIEGSPNLFAVIGHRFNNGQFVYPGSYYLPDLRGAYLKGCGYSDIWNSKTTSINVTGNKQFSNVGDHAHQYTDRGTETKDVGTGGLTQAVKSSSGTYWTDGYSYDSNSHAKLDVETRPNSIGINYIIKY